MFARLILAAAVAVTVTLPTSAQQPKKADVTADLSTIAMYDLKTGKTIMGTSSAHGKIYDTAKSAADFWKALGKVDTVMNVNDAFDPSFINSL